jgi:hypothetical protein
MSTLTKQKLGNSRLHFDFDDFRSEYEAIRETAFTASAAAYYPKYSSLVLSLWCFYKGPWHEIFHIWFLGIKQFPLGQTCTG